MEGIKEVDERRAWYSPWVIYHHDEEIQRAVAMIERKVFNLLEPEIFKPIIRALLDGGDCYMLLADLRSYIQTQEQVDAIYKNQSGLDRKAILNGARAGKFTTDRAIRECASEIWEVEPCSIVQEETA